MQPLCPLNEWCCHEQGRVLESSAACPVHLCAVLPDGSAVLRAGCRGFGCAQTVFAEGELHMPAERLCGSAAAHACPCLVEERERFFSFGIVRLYRLDSSTEWPLWCLYFIFTENIYSVGCINFSFL